MSRNAGIGMSMSSRRTFVAAVLAVLYVAGFSCSRAWAEGGTPHQARSMMQAIKERLLADRVEQSRQRVLLEAAGIELGTWQRIGPFRDQPPLLNWMDNVASSFAFEYEVEREVRANGNVPLLDMVYAAPNFPATPEAVRPWGEHADWIDGYYQELPRGPAPSTGETQYLYRTITVAESSAVEIDFIIRAPEADRRMERPGMEHWHRTGRYVWWVNGQEIQRWEGRNDMPLRVQVQLEKGVNHFFAKVTNNRHAYGFAFAIHGLHPAPRRERGFERLWRPLHTNHTTDLPFHRETMNQLPDWFSNGDTPFDTLEKTLTEYARVREQRETLVANFEDEAFPPGWQTEGPGFGDAPRTGPGQTGPGRSAVSWTPQDHHRLEGSLISPPFTLSRPFLLLELAGRVDDQTTRVRLSVQQADGSFAEVASLGESSGGHWRWQVLDAGEWLGKTARLELIDRQAEANWGWLALREVRLGDTPARMDQEFLDVLPDALRASAATAEERFMAELIVRSLFEQDPAAWIHGREQRDFRGILRDRIVDLLGRLTGVDARPLGQIADNEEFASAAVNVLRYHDALHRIMELKFYPEAMPGVEHAALDAQGRVVPAMEKALENHPKSPQGMAHTDRLAGLERVIRPLLVQLEQGDDPRVEEVLAAAGAIDDLWNQSIRELPPLLFLQRPSYGHDAMYFQGSGHQNATLHSFDPARVELNTVFRNPGRSHEVNLSFDGKTIYIGGGGRVQAVDAEGTNYRNIQSGQSPSEMPDGRIVFFDSDAGQAPCKAGGARLLLFISDPDGGNRKLVSANTCVDNSPTVMNDGRIIFARWDYGVNKNVFNRHAIWAQNPDGSAMDLYFGNTVIDPRAFYRPRQVPGRSEVVTVFGAHHANVAGLIGLVWNGEGREAADGVGFRRLTHDTASVGDHGIAWAYQDPWPLNEQLFLVSFGGRFDRKVGLYLIDRAGNKKCIIETLAGGVHSAQPFVARTRPTVIPDRTHTPDWESGVDLHERLLTDPDWGQKATMLLQDVYLGIEPEITRGRARYLAVMEQPPQSHPRGGAMGVGTIWYANRVVGLVPIEADGSAHFEVPALRSLYFHVLDEHGRMLMTQGSDFHAMPGERRSCVGCHEQRQGIDAPPGDRLMPLAARMAPVTPTMPDWGTNGIIEYEAVVQPVFDKYRVSCHSGPRPEGRLDLSGSRTTAYSMSYMQLTDKSLVHFTPGTGDTHAQPSNDYDEQAPLSRGSLLSRLANYLMDPDHSGEEIPFEDRIKVFLWIDSNVPFYSHYRQKTPTILSQPARVALEQVHARRCASCHDTPGRSDTRSGLNRHHVAVHAGGAPGQWGIADSGMRVMHLNLSEPGNSAAAQAPLPRSAGGWGVCVGEDGKAIFESRDDPDYRKMLEALETGVERRNEPGLAEILRHRGQSGN